MLAAIFIEYLTISPPFFFATIIAVVISITLHELAHGWVAIKHGDDTPIVTGHMTLNPLVHMGMFSLILLALVGIAFGAMPIDRTRLRGKYAESLVAVAGPATNLVLGVLAVLAMGLWLRFGSPPPDAGPGANGWLLLERFATLNIALMIFNMLPIPPLDGSHIMANISSGYRRLLSHEFAQGASTAIFFAMFLGAGVFIFRVSDWIAAKMLVAIVLVGR
jgi:Zn-dependent protease